MEEFLIPLIYLTLFVGCMIEGKTVLVAAIFASDKLEVGLAEVLLVAFSATIFIDLLYYIVGRIRSREVLWNRPNLIPFAEDLYKKLENRPFRVIIFHQFLNAFSQKVPYIIGTSNMKPLTFTGFVIFASLIWMVCFFLFGLLLKVLLTGMLGSLEQYELAIIFVILCSGILSQLVLHYRRERIYEASHTTPKSILHSYYRLQEDPN